MIDLQAIKDRHPPEQVNALGSKDMQDIRDLITECERLTAERDSLIEGRAALTRTLDRKNAELSARDDAELDAYAQGKKDAEVRLSAEGRRMREALTIIADHYEENWHPGLTHETGQRFAKIAHKALNAVSGSPSRSA